MTTRPCPTLGSLDARYRELLNQSDHLFSTPSYRRCESVALIVIGLLALSLAATVLMGLVICPAAAIVILGLVAIASVCFGSALTVIVLFYREKQRDNLARLHRIQWNNLVCNYRELCKQTHIKK